MKQEEFRAVVRETVKALIDSIAAGEYDKIPDNVDIDESWYSDGMTREEALAEFKDWLEGQLAFWNEKYDADYVFDAFRDESLNRDEWGEWIEDEDGSEEQDFVEYQPTSHGEDIDFWFEINIENEGGDKPRFVFNINI